MFDIIILLLLGILSIIMVDMAFKSKRAFKKAKLFADMQLEMMNDSTAIMRSMSQDLKQIAVNTKTRLADVKESGLKCHKYEIGECKLCGGSGDCVIEKMKVEIKDIERMSTKPQRTVNEK